MGGIKKENPKILENSDNSDIFLESRPPCPLGPNSDIFDPPSNPLDEKKHGLKMPLMT